MNKQTLIRGLIIAVPAAAVAITAYIYNETGHLPFQKPAETVSAPAGTGASERDQAAVEDTQSPADQVAETTSAEPDGQAADTATLKGPSFDVVGVEPTGETVVAGRSVAGAIVALTANGEVVGKSIANQAGEWTIILDEPLKPGDYDVGLEVHDEKGVTLSQSEQRVAVSVPEGGNEQPLVVLNSPEGPSDILQKPDAGQDVARAGDAPDAEDPAATKDETAKEESVAAAPAEPETAGADGSESVIASSGTAAGETEPAADGKAGAGTKPAAQTSADAPQQVAAAPETTDAPAASKSALETAGSNAVQAPAAGAEAGSAGNTGPAAPTVTVEAVESEKDKVYVAGTGEPGSSVRVYVGEDFQGEAKVDSGGKWLVQGTKNVAEGNVEVRADLIAEDGNSVDARAAVTFEKEQDKQIVLTKVVATGASGAGEGQGAEVRKSLPVVIIRKGDNLWRISRRLYGDGVRYTTIYQANQDQIRNPDLIYPGQVFLTPEGDLNWPQAPADNG